MVSTPGQFGDPARTDPGKFAGSYFDYLGTGDPSDPRQYYMYGFDGLQSVSPELIVLFAPIVSVFRGQSFFP